MARSICTGCLQPETTCLCPYIHTANHQTRVWIIQCGKETQHPKNTANLLPKLSDKITLLQERDITAIKTLQERLLKEPKQSVVLFPSEDSIPLKELITSSQRATAITDLLLIDGTWRKAKRFIFENQWLNSLTKTQLSERYDSRYHIRKTSVENGLSTLEATAYALNELEHIDTKPFLHLLKGINTVFTKHMPESVKNRY